MGAIGSLDVISSVVHVREELVVGDDRANCRGWGGVDGGSLSQRAI